MDEKSDRGRILIFSIEMTKREISARLLSIIAKIPLTKIIERTLNNEELVKISTAARRIAESGLAICDKPVSALDIVHTVRAVSRVGRINIVVVDYAQLVKPMNAKINREQDVSNTGWQMKMLAKEIECAVILLSQLNKEGISRESEALEMHADVMLVVKEHGNPRKKYIDVTKQRNGPTGEVECNFYPPCVALY